MKFKIYGDYDVGVDTFWKSVFFDEGFTAHLYRHGLNFDRLEILSDELLENGERKRRLKAYPNFDMPLAVRKRLGTQFCYVEDGHYDPKNQRWTTDIHLPRLGQKLTIRSAMTFSDNGPNRSTRLVEFDVNVNIFGFRRIVEPFLERTLKHSYEQARVVTNEWIHEHVDEAQRHRSDASS